MMEYRQTTIHEKGDDCHLCGPVDSVVVHHVDGDRTNNSLENLIPVCRSCHGKIHAGTEGYEDWHRKLSSPHPVLELLERALRFR